MLIYKCKKVKKLIKIKMPTIEETVNTLKDMGFTEAQAKKALNKTGWTGIEAAAEWLLSNPGDDGTEDASEDPPAGEVRKFLERY